MQFWKKLVDSSSDLFFVEDYNRASQTAGRDSPGVGSYSERGSRVVKNHLKYNTIQSQFWQITKT
jgi:hypothetical protein